MTSLIIPSGISERIATEVRVAGAGSVETGGFMLAVAGCPASVLALTGECGIERKRDLFHVGGLAIATLFDWVETRELTVSAQWHSHRQRAFLSETDLAYGFNVSGFHTTVVPDYERASGDPNDWRWWTFDGEGWRATPAPTVTRAAFTVMTFEEGHVYEH